MFQVGDRVSSIRRAVPPQISFVGQVRSSFTNLSGERFCVVENSHGMLMVFHESELRSAPFKPKIELIFED